MPRGMAKKQKHTKPKPKTHKVSARGFYRTAGSVDADHLLPRGLGSEEPQSWEGFK